MAYQADYLTPMQAGTTAGLKAWTYITADDGATVLGAGYFNDSTKNFVVGERISVSQVDDLIAPLAATDTYVLYITAVGQTGIATVALQVATIATGSIANTDLADMPEQRLKGRAVGAGTGSPVDLTPIEARAVIGSNLSFPNLAAFQADTSDLGGSMAVGETINVAGVPFTVLPSADTAQYTNAGATTPVKIAEAGPEFTTRAVIPMARIPAWIDEIESGAFAASGDGGGASYKRSATEPSHPGKVQSADGAWWEYVPGPEGVNVRAFGAADGAESTQAFKDAFDTLLGLPSTIQHIGVWLNGYPNLFIPSGTYNLDLSAGDLWNPAAGAVKRGIIIKGAGIDATYLNITAGASRYIFRNDNEVNTTIMSDFSVSQTYVNDGTENALYYGTSSGTFKQPWFNDIELYNMSGIKLDGTGNADHLRVDRMVFNRVPPGGYGFDIDNPQSVGHRYDGVIFRQLYGTGVLVRAGGEMIWTGGSIVVGLDGLFLDIEGSGVNIGSGNNNYAIQSPRFEMRNITEAGNPGADPRAVVLNAPAVVNLEFGTYQTDELSATRTLPVYEISRGHLLISNVSNWGAEHTIVINAGDNDATTDLPAEVTLQHCHLKAPLSDLVTINDPPGGVGRWAHYGRARAVECYGVADNNPVDADMNATHGQRSSTVGLKRAYFTRGNGQVGLPANGAPITVQLPIGAVVQQVGFLKRAGSGSGGVTYSWNQAGAAVFTSATPLNNGQRGTERSVPLEIEITTTAEGVWTFENVTASAVAANGYCFVDYF